jgi:hypothetical protein
LHAWEVPDAPAMYGGFSISENEVETLRQDACEFVERAIEAAVPDGIRQPAGRASCVLPVVVIGTSVRAIAAGATANAARDGKDSALINSS